jgi:hypothetical protein
MVSEVQCTGSFGECLLCLLCAPALAQILQPPTASCLGDGPRLGTLCVHAPCPAHIFHYAAVGSLVELSWKHAHGSGHAVLGASWVRDVLRNLKHRAFLANAPQQPHARRLPVLKGLYHSVHAVL